MEDTKIVIGTSLRVLVLSIALVFTGYTCLAITNHYSVDSFNLLFDSSPYWQLQLGRYTNFGVIILASKLGVHPVVQQRAFCLLWMLALGYTIGMISIVMIRCTRVSKSLTQMMVVFAVSIAFINVFMMELVLFPEVMMASILGVIALGLSICFAVSDLMLWKKWLLSTLCLLIALGNYQGYIGIYISFVLIGNFWKRHSNNLHKYAETMLALTCGGFASIVNVISIKALIHLGIIVDPGQGPKLDIHTIKNNIWHLIKYQKRFWSNADGLLPDAIMPVVGIILAVFVIALCLRLKKGNRIFYLFILSICYILCFAAHIIQARIIMNPRSNLAIWSFVSGGVISAVGFMQIEKTKIFKWLIPVCTLTLLCCNIFYMHDMAANTLATNAVDFMEAEQICAKIIKYESESPNTITKVAVVNDNNVTVYTEPSRYRNWELGSRILVTPYSGYRLIGYQLGRSLKKIPMPDNIYNQYFVGKDWSYLNVDEQMILIGDTLYLAIY